VDESFGHLMPILAVDSVEQAIRLANEIDSTPLGLYAFGNKAETEKGKPLIPSNLIGTKFYYNREILD
jgi:acyl-CoA reductase-like NAD-dependent aldehyde dehydrogenase